MLTDPGCILYRLCNYIFFIGFIRFNGKYNKKHLFNQSQQKPRNGTIIKFQRDIDDHIQYSGTSDYIIIYIKLVKNNLNQITK